MNFKLLLKGLVILLTCIALSVLLWIFSQLLGIYWVYGLYLSEVVSAFGLDIIFSRMIAALLTILTLLSLPWIISFLFLRKRRFVLLVVGGMLIVGGTFAIYYGSSDVFFDRETGKSVKYYIKTLDGFKFSNTDDYDPKLGIKYKPITPEVVKEFYFWEKTGKMQNTPSVIHGKYFDKITGEPIVWYTERPEGERELFPLPGHDPLTGKNLKPMTAEIVGAIAKAEKEQELKLKKTSSSQSGIADYLNKVCNQQYEYIQSAENDFLDWYFSYRGGLVHSRATAINNHYDGTHLYDISVEKIISEKPYTIIGITLEAPERTVASIQGSIVDKRGIRYRPDVILYSGPNNIIVAGETKRVFFIIEGANQEDFNSGSFSYDDRIIIPFTKK